MNVEKNRSQMTNAEEVLELIKKIKHVEMMNKTKEKRLDHLKQMRKH